MADPDIKAQIAAAAEKALDDDGTATVEKEADPAKPEEDSAAADEGDSSDESEEGKEDDEKAEKTDEEDDSDSDEDDEEADSEDDLDDENEDEEDKAEKPVSRSQKRIKELIREKKLSDDENAVLKAQLAAKDGTPAEKAAADKELLKQGYTAEQIAEGQKFLKSLGYMSPKEVSEMQKKIQRIEDKELIAEDRQELREALKKSKSELTEKDVMQYVQKWGTSKNPKIAARASLDYGTIIKLIANKKVVEKVVDATLKAKKKSAPKVPAGGGGALKKKEDTEDSRWNPGDRMGSLERLQEKATAHLEDE